TPRPTTRTLPDALPICQPQATGTQAKRPLRGTSRRSASRLTVQPVIEQGDEQRQQQQAAHVTQEKRFDELPRAVVGVPDRQLGRSEEHTSELQSREKLV